VSNILISLEIDYEEMLKQHTFLCWLKKHIVMDKDPDDMEGILNMYDAMIEIVFKSTCIYDNSGKTAERYMVIFPDNTVYMITHDTDSPRGVYARYHTTEDCITWTTLKDGSMTPVGHEKEVSIREVGPVVRRRIRNIIQTNGMDED